MAENAELTELLRDLFSSQLLAVLGTQSENGPYGNLVAFAATGDLKLLLFATLRSTRKYQNIADAPKAAMVIDNRSNQEADFNGAVAVTATGSVIEVPESERDALQKVYLAKHPQLHDFLESPACALLKVEVDHYHIVRLFQQVVTVSMNR